MSASRVLVTGGGGFLGQYVVEQHLARGDEVRSYSRNRYEDLDRLGVEQFCGDLGQDDEMLDRACQGVDIVQHTAAIAGIWGPWRQYHAINTLGTERVIQACRRAGVGRLVYTSSPSVTFDGQAQEGIDESVGFAERFNCNYPKSKALGERAVLAANERGKLLTCALRPHLIWGPRDQHLIPRLLDRARSGKLRRVGSGENLIDTIYVENAAAAQLNAADALARDPESPTATEAGGAIKPGSAAGRAYFLSQDEPVNCWDWIDEILALADLPKLGRGVPYPVAWTAGALMEAAFLVMRRRDEPRMTRFLAAQLAKPHYFDISAARRDLGYEPAVSTVEGMDRLATWLDSQRGKPSEYSASS